MNNVEQCCREMIPHLIHAGFRGKKTIRLISTMKADIYLDLGNIDNTLRTIRFTWAMNKFIVEEKLMPLLIEKDIKQGTLDELLVNLKPILIKVTFPFQKGTSYVFHDAIVDLDNLTFEDGMSYD